ncbi:PREDICTED: polygalacturonase inhibitor-like [Nicotiana attenuata]|uniref:Polygalacturonase inhibitor n=1 Tax=Nicotiana attenuata TaxID=49451 RepID=A0A1J6L6U2_NICAT|nr:PREDICTED: polygalacturonase inhibitor-like [Nicotiana attenuata]OIT26833.1 polygalacturonase inhibitor [Nicotiana attenuata]
MQMKSSFLPILFFSLLLVFSFPSLSHSVRCNPKDKKVLLKIKNDLRNPYHLASWDPNTDCCYWYVVKCDRKTNRINALTVFQANISGQIPAAVGDLPFLETLQFHHITNLTGTIPPTIAKLTNLKMLRLSFTNLSGPIPQFLSQLKNLFLLELNYNQFTGTIPSSLSELPNLLAIHLDRNKLTGQIPESFGNFRGQIPSLYLSHNSLTGPVPKSLGNLNFTTLDFSRNKLEGDVSFLFGKNKAIQIIDLSRNTLQFDISKVEFPESLTWLDLNHNRIFGRLPQGLKDLQLQNLNVSYNRLCGQIPQGGKLQSFDVYSYFHNKCLCGSPLPECK